MVNNSVEVKVAIVTHDPQTNSPVLVLKSESEGVAVPIWIGPYEAYAIMMEIEGIEPPRPMSHDLLKNVILALGAELEYIELTDIEDGTYFAQLIVSVEDDSIGIDCRPSDAVALALRCRVPIYISREIIDLILEGAVKSKENQTDIETLLKNLKPSDFEIEDTSE